MEYGGQNRLKTIGDGCWMTKTSDVDRKYVKTLENASEYPKTVENASSLFVGLENGCWGLKTSRFRNLSRE